MTYRKLLYRIIGYSLLTIFIAVAITAPYLVLKLVIIVWAVNSIGDTRRRIHAAEERVKALENKQSAANQILIRPESAVDAIRCAIDTIKKTQSH